MIDDVAEWACELSPRFWLQTACGKCRGCETIEKMVAAVGEEEFGRIMEEHRKYVDELVSEDIQRSFDR